MKDFDASSLLGLSTVDHDHLDERRESAYREFLGLPAEQPSLAIHWMLFGGFEASERPDGNPKALRPLCELPFPRRMWAGGQLKWIASIPRDVPLQRSTTVIRSKVKEGRTATILFLTFSRRVATLAGAVLVEEEHDFAFLPADARPGAGPGEPLGFTPEWSRRCQSSSVELFRYSALTFNSHRIHYDAPYARESEHYADIVVHAPLLATLLMQESAGRARRIPCSFSYRAVRPTTVDQGFALAGRTIGPDTIELAVAGDDNTQRMLASMQFVSGRR